MNENNVNIDHDKKAKKKRIQTLLLFVLLIVGIASYIFKFYYIMVIFISISIIVAIIFDFFLYNKQAKDDKIFSDNNYDKYAKDFIAVYLSRYFDNIELIPDQSEALNNFKQTIFNKYKMVDTYNCSVSSKFKIQNHSISLAYLTAYYIRTDAGEITAGIFGHSKIEMFKGFFIEIDLNKNTNSNIVITEYKNRLEMPLFNYIPFKGYRKIGLKKIANLYIKKDNAISSINNNFINKYCELLNNFAKKYDFRILNSFAMTEPKVVINIENNKAYLIIRANNYINNIYNSMKENEENFAKYDLIIKYIIDVISIVDLM